ncbi:DEAD/DEAH box helicase [Methanoplanus limicola]|uniref:ATP dependent helicase, Lhr family n=1 Tax=Methanoplanus limicola DSM 2279 TaxID=937775 RepID=H1Z1P2_9EURY|nr:DEAD/DEAH box helicase [Methanoplanus limicola]EHQ34568.1 ATP dependent helicase, Lhr family [Methanoplanus limicola DSM 2279]
MGEASDLIDRNIAELLVKRGFDTLSDTQEKAIPPISAGNHTLCIAPTGTGKTESAMLPVFSSLLHTGGGGFKAIYITPLRSLNRDILFRLEWWCSELGLTVGVRHGDTSTSERTKQSKKPPDLLITTPETLQALFMGKNLREHLKNVRYVIIDEIHELAGNKRGAQLSVALERLIPYAGNFQRIGLSATVGNPGDVASFLTGNRPCEIVNIPAAPSLSIDVRYAGGSFTSQSKAVEKAIEREDSTLVFVNTRVTAEALGHELFGRGDVDVHHGSLSREVRIEAEDRFKEGKLKALICTSSMELGLDIGHISHVIQFGSPREISRLLQRVGRAGHRLDTMSYGTILATGFDDLLESGVIATRALQNECEDLLLSRNASDVLANQIAAIAVEYGEISVLRLKEIITGSACFQDAGGLIERVILQMAEHRLIWPEGGMVARTGRCRKYLYQNLSMIHDEKKVKVYDIVSRRIVGTLDESFVVSFIYTGAVFITKGQLWQVIVLEDGMIKVEPAHKLKGELPSWEGEQIPVPYGIARETGRLRRTRNFSDYLSDGASISFAESFMDGMDHAGSPVPSDNLIVLEHFDEGVVMNVCGGHKANEALGRAVSVLLSARSGSSVGIEVDAYRVTFRLPKEITATAVMEALKNLEPAHIQGILSLSLKRSSLFKWKLVQIAKKFGAIDADADYEKISIHRLMDLFDKTVISDEAFRELFSLKMDVEKAAEIARRVQSGETGVTIAPISAIGSEGITSSRDLIPPPSTDHAVISTIKKRIENDSILLFCMNCRKWKSKTVVGRVPDDIVCPLCGARLIAALKPYEDDQIAIAKKKNKSKEERAVEIKMIRNANIVLSSGKTAVTALAARGVGPDTASGIIATMAKGDDFYREILKAERNYIRTHRFW